MLDPGKFLTLDRGDNILRIISSPFLYYAHRINNRIEKCSQDQGVVDCQKCADFGTNGDEAILHSGAITRAQQKRWLAGVIDRKSGDTLVFDFPIHVFYHMQKLNRDEDWGDPRTYDINIIADPDAMEANKYSIMPRPKRKLTKENKKADEKLIVAFDPFLKEMSDFCNPNLTHVNSNPWHMIKQNIVYGATCSSCGNYFPHAENVGSFRCWACRNGW